MSSGVSLGEGEGHPWVCPVAFLSRPTAPFSIFDGPRQLASPSAPTRRLLGVCCVPGVVTVLRCVREQDTRTALLSRSSCSSLCSSPLHAEYVVGLRRESGC